MSSMETLQRSRTRIDGPEGERLLARLRALRSRARLYLVITGLSSVALAVVASSLLTFIVDRLFKLPRETRAAVLVVAAAVIVFIFARRLVARLRAPLPLDELAREVERALPVFDWRLVSAVQLVELGVEGETSPELARAIVAEASQVAETVRFEEALDDRAAGQRAGIGAVVLVAGGLLVLGFPDAARTWFLRSVLLSRTEEWPKATRLRVAAVTPRGHESFEESPTLAIPRGTDLVIEVQAEGEIPPSCWADWKLQGGQSDSTALSGLENGRFRIVFDRLDQDIAFSVRGGDDQKGEFVVRALRRPSLAWIEVKPTPPPYTHLQIPPFRAEAGEVELPEGTNVVISTAATRTEPPARLKRAWADLRISGTKVDDPPLHIEGQLDAEKEKVSIAMVLSRTTAIGLDVEDGQGLGLERPVRLTLRARADAPPKVSLGLRGVGQMVTPEVTLPLDLGASDDYGLNGGDIRLKASGGGLEAPREDVHKVDDLGGLRREAKLQLLWDLSPLGFKPGTMISIQATAKDDDPKGAKTTTSGSFGLRVVAAEELLNDMLRRQHEARRELERARDDEEKLSQGLAALDDKTLERGVRAQRAIVRTIGEVGRVIAQVVEEMKWNKVLEERDRNRLQEGVVLPLERLREGQAAAAREAIEAAAGAKGDDRKAKMKEAGAACDASLIEIQAILERMKKIEDVTAVIARLKAILEEQRKVLEATKKQREGR